MNQMPYVCSKFHEYIFDEFKIIDQTQWFYTKNYKGASFARKMELKILFCANYLMMLYICTLTKFPYNTFDCFKIYRVDSKVYKSITLQKCMCSYGSWSLHIL